MDLRFSAQDERFRTTAREWLEDNLSGGFAELRGRGGPGDEHADVHGRQAWEQTMAAAGWTCLAWPTKYGGQELSLAQQMIFNEEYARARAPGRVGHIGEHLLGPTLIAFGSDDQRARFLPAIASAEALWCQGYSEPNAGSDLANVQTRAVLDGDRWVITGQKTWTSLAHHADWCFAMCRTDTDAPKHKGLSYLLVPMHQDGIDIRPIEQLTRTSEFNEVFFDGARAAKADVVGGINNGWRIAMATLGFERGASTLGQQMGFKNELDAIIAIAKDDGAIDDPLIRQRLADAWMGLRIMRLNALRMLAAAGADGSLGREALITKLHWATWHQNLGKLAMDVLGDDAEVLAGAPYDLGQLQTMFLFSRSDTIYAGSNEIQRNIIAERGLGLPR